MEETTTDRTYSITHVGNALTVTLEAVRYHHGGRLAVQMNLAYDGEPYTTLSINKPGLDLADDEFLFKTYSENEGLLEELLRVGAVELTGRTTDLGPICRLAARK